MAAISSEGGLIPGRFRNGLLLLCLFAPSVWMIATIPPLWRDVDAYNQLTLHPLITTFWGHAPAYNYIVKVPLFLGEQWERWRGIPLAPPLSGSTQLTDTGVWLLIIAQHLALCCAAFYFIRAVTASSWLRLVLALLWASNALFYTFAHCVGSETLGLILVVAMVGKGLRLFKTRSEPSWVDWYLFAIGLCLCLLSRHVNGLLIALLPTAFLLRWAQNGISSRFAANERQRRWRRRIGSRLLQQAMIAIGIGLACWFVANSLTQRLARKTRFHPHSRMGYTFLWRLQFLKTLPPPQRDALLNKVIARTRSSEARQLVTLLKQMHEEGAAPVASSFSERAIPLLFPSEPVAPWEKLDVAFNQMALAFLLPPPPELWRVAQADFAAALNMSLTEIVDLLFETTAYFFEHKDEMPACAGLVTFRDTNAETLNGMPSRHPYFHLWRGLTFNRALVIWLGSLLVFVVITRGRKRDVTAISAFGIALVTIGLLMVASACLLTESLPRYTLPMWQLLLLSLYIFAGSIGDFWSRHPSRLRSQAK